MAPYKLVHGDAQSPAHRSLIQIIELAIADGDLSNSLLAPIVVAILFEETQLEISRPLNSDLVIRGIQLSDEYFVQLHKSAGCRDYQRDFPQTITPILVSIALSLESSTGAHAVIIRLCNAVADRLRIELIWPVDLDAFNDLTSKIYSACREATCLDDDNVLVALRGLPILGPK